MKIAVLFGSFNPMTNAHVAALKTAMDALQADKGLFVATNGKYLKKKTVKIGDPFYLTQEERQSIIEQVCEEEESLAFGGFELGGIMPSRFKTLCALQRKNPGAEIVEIMGADKVHTLTKSSYADDYLTRFKIAVFARNDIGLEELFAQNPVLTQHRESFIFLPALEAVGEVSSTIVRQRFYAGQDSADLIPAAAVAVLQQHKPEDFSITFPQRMEITMQDGRFGMRKAAKEVYLENAKLFREWKDGNSQIAFGDRQAFLNNTKLYTRAYSIDGQGTIYPDTVTGCINMDCVDLAQYLMEKGYSPAILNLASARSPGGGYHAGFAAQEESLCHSSNLSQSLYQFGNPKYKHIRDCGVPIKTPGYPLDLNFGGVYTPNVTFFRNGRTRFFALREASFQCDVITVAALSFNGRKEFSGIDELSFRSDDGGFTLAGAEVMRNKIRTIFRMGVEHGKDALVLGAFGCGAYKLPSDAVAQLFRQVMNEPEFAGKFRLLVFAILESTRKPNGLNGKFAPFYREFGTFSMT